MELQAQHPHRGLVLKRLVTGNATGRARIWTFEILERRELLTVGIQPATDVSGFADTGFSPSASANADHCSLATQAGSVAGIDVDYLADELAADGALGFSTAMSPTLKIHDVQGTGPAVSDPGTVVTLEGVVIGDHQGSNELNGFFLQEEDTDVDNDSNTSEGIFVYCGTCSTPVSEGQIVQVTGVQEEFFGMSQLDTTGTGGIIHTIDAGNNLHLITPASVDLPARAATHSEATFEQYEGMLVQFVDELTATEYFQLGRFGQIVLSEGGKLRQFTNDHLPDAAGYRKHLHDTARRRIILDDLNNIQNNTDPAFHPQPGGFSTSNFIRGGDTVSNLTGVLHWSFAGQADTNAWRIRPQVTNPVLFNAANPRQATPSAVGGDVKVATLNVLNFFTTIDVTRSNSNGDCGPSGTLDCRGADSAAEMTRQTDKLVAALEKIDADVLGLVELENNATGSLQAIVSALNSSTGATYDYIDTGTIGNDAIKVGFIYNTDAVSPSRDFAVLDSSDFVDPNNTGIAKNRPAIAQTFEVTNTNNPSFGGRFTPVINHLKSKGSNCGVGDDDTTTGQGSCNLTRTKAAEQLVDWLATDPTESGDPDFLVLGDLNAYALEDPIQAIKAGIDDTRGTVDDFTDLVLQLSGPDAYSYVFDGQWGYLDHALASASMTAQVTGLTQWHVNSDEVNLLDYNDGVRDAGEAFFEAKPNSNNLYSADPYRASDHDPVILGLSLIDHTGDFNLDGVLNAVDIDLLYAEVSQETYHPIYDLTADGLVNRDDVDRHVRNLLHTEYGDANLDGRVNSRDAAILSSNFGTLSGATWGMGSFNGDGKVNSSDAAILAGKFGFEHAGSSVAVPTERLIREENVVGIALRRAADENLPMVEQLSQLFGTVETTVLHSAGMFSSAARLSDFAAHDFVDLCDIREIARSRRQP